MPKEKWTLEVLQAEAKKYSHRTQFAKGSPNAYAAAARKKLLDTICMHMEKKKPDQSARRLFDENQAKTLAEEYEAGANMQQLAEKYGTNATTIFYTLKRLDIKTRSTGDHNVGNYKFSEEDEDVLIEEYVSGSFSMTTLAKKHRTTVITISKIFRRRGVKLKGRAIYVRKPRDLLGKKFGLLTVIEQAEKRNGRIAWLCKCDCGSKKRPIVTSQNLLSGGSKSCGCLAAESNRIDLKGKRFGRLKVIRLNRDESSRKKPKWNCLCDCGKEKVISGDMLRSGRTKSCGCLKAEGFIVYNNIDHQQKREKEHKECLKLHKRVELTEPYRGKLSVHQYRCLDHDQIHPARADQAERGDGLYCCRIANNQFDSLQKAISGNLRAASEEEWLYIYEMQRFPDLVKIGISSNPSGRAVDIEYGDEISSWLFEERVDAYIVEQSIHHQTIESARLPDELAGWKGVLEVRQLEKEESKDIAQYYIDEFYELGRWEFALAYAPLTDRQKKDVLEKYFK